MSLKDLIHHVVSQLTYSEWQQMGRISTYINTKMSVCVCVCVFAFPRPFGIRLGYSLAQMCF